MPTGLTWQKTVSRILASPVLVALAVVAVVGFALAMLDIPDIHRSAHVPLLFGSR